jgi:type 2 lantibiotic biosynthesis protein LanM
MEEMDIPIFWSRSSSVNLEDAFRTVAHEQMREEAYKQVEERIRSLDEAEIELQISYLRVSLFLREHEHAKTYAVDAVTVHTTNEVHAPDADELIEAAMDIARTLGRTAIEAKNGCCTWITIGMIPGTDRCRMQPMRLPLYDGLAGVALFLSALGSVTGDKDVMRLCNASIHSLRNDTARFMELGKLDGLMPLGIASGVSSIIYAHLKINELLKDESHLDDALNLVSLITDSIIDDDSEYDIISGSAGCLLALTALHEVTGDARALDTAVKCGNHVLEARTFRDNAMEWRTNHGAMLTGFSHGAAGLAFALLRLFEHTGNTAYREAAEQAVAYENGYFNSGHENWPDLRNAKQKGGCGQLRFMTSWCHGATGIGLARLGALHLMDNDEIRSNIMAARHATEKAAMNAPDQMCCGIMGRVEFLSLLARSYNDTKLMDSAMSITGSVLDRALCNGCYSLFHDPSNAMQFAGFFQGLSGIGYQFLRLSQPDRIPNVLLFQ